MITYFEEDSLFVYQLHGTGIYAKEVQYLANTLKDVARKLGLKRLEAVTNSLVNARLYMACGGKIDKIYLSLEV